jgi:hypothetical protein
VAGGIKAANGAAFEGCIQIAGKLPWTVRIAALGTAILAAINGNPSAPTGSVPSFTGSGPRGMVELSLGVKSSSYVRNFPGHKPVDFIFDPLKQVFRMGNHAYGHPGLARGSESIVGGTIWRQAGQLVTNEHSGHYGHLWTPEVRAQFVEFMQSFGVAVTHSNTW